MNDELEQLKQQVAELYAWMQQRKEHQIVSPLDDDSRAAIGAVSGTKPGSKTLTQVVGTAGATATVPAAYAGSEIVIIRGKQREIPYL